MSTFLRSAVILSMLSLLAISVFAQNVSITDYEVPVSSARQLRANADWNWSQTGNVVNTNSVNAAALFRQFYSSLPFAWFLNADGTTGKTLANEWTYSTRASAEARKYIFDDQDWFASGRLRAEVAKEYDQVESDARVGAGYGRYINATALAKAVRIEGHLKNENVIKANLPKETMIKIANIVERESEYRDLYGTTYEVQWFADIEKEIAASNELVGDNVGAIGLLRIRQVLFGINERVNDRYYGWDLSAGVLFRLSDKFGGDLGSPQLSLVGNYAYPIDWRMQVNAVAEANTPLDSSFFDQLDIRAGADFFYELSNRINFTTTYRLGLLKEPNIDDWTTRQALNASFLFYLENQINYSVTASLTKIGDADAFKSISMGVQYNVFY